MVLLFVVLESSHIHFDQVPGFCNESISVFLEYCYGPQLVAFLVSDAQEFRGARDYEFFELFVRGFPLLYLISIEKLKSGQILANNGHES